jgi:hypothetical protein
VRSQAELERARRHFREVFEAVDRRRLGEPGEIQHLLAMGVIIDVLSWSLNDGQPFIGPDFVGLVRLLDEAEGNTPN